MTTFSELGVPAGIIDALARGGITKPFPIQAMCVADALAGRDLSGRAPTGSGKTLAFAIPLAIRAGKAGHTTGRGGKGANNTGRPRALVLVPTRELAAQVANELTPLAAASGRTVATFFGGTSIARDQRRLATGIDIAVACPGRLADLVKRRNVDLSEVDMVVVDEADRMADMGFLPEVRRLLDQTRDDRQTLLFSATLDGDVDVLVRNYQRDPVRRELSTTETPVGDVTHHFWRTDPSRRVQVTSELIKAGAPAIVFTRTKHGADRVAKQLKRAGVRAAAIHGGRSQNQRTRALEDFSAGRATALIATDVAARGIHVDDVGIIVHFDPAGTDKDYVHRSGRTGRAGANGTVVTLVVPEKMNDVRKLQRALQLPSGIGDVAVESLHRGDAAAPGGTQPVLTAAPVTRTQPPSQRKGNTARTAASRQEPRGNHSKASRRHRSGARPSGSGGRR